MRQRQVLKELPKLEREPETDSVLFTHSAWLRPKENGSEQFAVNLKLESVDQIFQPTAVVARCDSRRSTIRNRVRKCCAEKKREETIHDGHVSYEVTCLPACA